MTWNIVSDSSCDLLMKDFASDLVRFETVPLRLQVGELEFIDNDELVVPELLTAMAASIMGILNSSLSTNSWLPT